MKKTLSILLAALTIAILFCLPVSAAEEPTGGTCGSQVTWSLDGTTLTISGTGDMDNYSSSNAAPWSSSRSLITGIVVEEGVTHIGTYAFFYFNALQDVTLPDSLTSIGSYGFFCCNALTEISLPGKLSAIGDYAFYHSSISELTVPSSVSSIGNYAFSSNPLKVIQFSSGLKSIGKYAFSYCNFTRIQFPDSLVSIDSRAFYSSNNLILIDIPSSVITIADDAFEGSGFLHIIGDADSAAQSYAAANKKTFWPRDTLTGTCGSGLTWSFDFGLLTISGNGAMNDYARDAAPWYAYSSLVTKLVIGDGVSGIGTYAFGNCRMTEAILGNSIRRIGKHAFEYCSKLSQITLPDSLKTIESEVFLATSLTEIAIPASVDNIASDFARYAGIANIYVDTGNLSFSSVDGVLFNKDGSTLLCYPGNKQGVSYAVPANTQKIAEYAFASVHYLERVTLAEQTRYVADYAFEDNLYIAEIILPDNMSYLGKSAFEGCSGLQGITLPTGLSTVSQYLFSDARELFQVKLPYGVTTIANGAFGNCSSLTSLVLPESVKSINHGAFANCTELTALTVPGSVTSIDSGAFNGCSDALVFYGDPNSYAESFANQNGILFIDRSKCSGTCLSGQSWSFECGVLEITGSGQLGGYAMLGTPWYPFEEAITTLILPEGLTGMGAYCFRGCTHIKNVYFDGTKEQWEAVVSNSDTFFDPLDELNAATFHYAADGVVTRRAFALENLSFESGYDGMVSVFGLYDIPVTGIRDALYKDVTEALSNAFAGADEDDISYLYLSCHGYDTGVNVASDKSISYQTLKKQLDIIPGTKVILMNSCNSGRFIPIFEYGNFTDVLPTPGTFYDSDYKVLVSSRADELSRGSLAANAWFNGLGWDVKTNAECETKADANKDHEITLEELYQYAPLISCFDAYDGDVSHHPMRWPVNDNTAIFVKQNDFIITMPAGSCHVIKDALANNNSYSFDFTVKSGSTSAPIENISVETSLEGIFKNNDDNVADFLTISNSVANGDSFRISVTPPDGSKSVRSCIVKVTVKCGDSTGDYIIIVPGDVNDSGTINSSDTAEIMKVVNGITAMPAEGAAGGYLYELMDLNGTGSINASDVAFALRMINSIITTN